MSREELWKNAISQEKCCKEIILKFRGKLHPVKLFRFIHPIIVKQQLDVGIRDIMYLRFMALRNVNSGRLIRLRPHFMFQEFNFLDPERVQSGQTYELLVRDYSKISKDMLDEKSMNLLKMKFESLTNEHGYITYDDVNLMVGEKKKLLKQHITSQMDSFLDRMSSISRQKAESSGFGSTVKHVMNEAENALNGVALLIMQAMDVKGNRTVSLDDWLDHWAKMCLFIYDPTLSKPKSKSSLGRIASRESLYTLESIE